MSEIPANADQPGIVRIYFSFKQTPMLDIFGRPRIILPVGCVELCYFVGKTECFR